MIVLGLDASGDGAGAAILDADGVRGACWAGRGVRPAAALLALADRALEAAGLDRSALEGVAVGLGDLGAQASRLGRIVGRLMRAHRILQLGKLARA